MKFAALLFSAVALLAPSAVLAGNTPALFDLTSTTKGLDGLVWSNAMYSGGNVYIGNIKYSISSEPLLCTLSPPLPSLLTPPPYMQSSGGEG